MRRLIMLLAVLLIAQLSGLGQGAAMANSAPPRFPGGKGGVLLPGENGQIHVLREELRFELAQDLSRAAVTARYVMENRGAALSQFPILFVIQDQGGWDQRPFTVSWNGATLPATLMGETEVDAAQLSEVREAWGALEAVWDPIAGQFYTDEWYGYAGLSFIQFHLDLPAGAVGMLEVAYEQAAAEDRVRYAHRLYGYHYLLTPATGWGSFGPVTIRIQAPGPNKVYFGSNLEFRYESGEYRAELPGLPEQNLAFSVVSKKGLIGNLVQPGPYYWMAFIILLALAWLVGQGIGRLASRLRLASRGTVILIGVAGGIFVGGLVDAVLVPLVFAIFPAIGAQGGYDMAFFGIGQWFVAVMVTIITAGVVAGRRREPAGA